MRFGVEHEDGCSTPPKWHFSIFPIVFVTVVRVIFDHFCVGPSGEIAKADDEIEARGKPGIFLHRAALGAVGRFVDLIRNAVLVAIWKLG